MNKTQTQFRGYLACLGSNPHVPTYCICEFWQIINTLTSVTHFPYMKNGHNNSTYCRSWYKVKRDSKSEIQSPVLDKTFVLKKWWLFFTNHWGNQLLNFCQLKGLNLWTFIDLSGTPRYIRSDHIRSVTQSCPTLCDPMNCSTPDLPVHHQLPEFTQTHVHRVSDAIQPSHPLSSPSPPAPNPSQQQGLVQWINSSHEVAKVLEFQL